MPTHHAVSGETIARLDRIRTVSLLVQVVLFAAAQIALGLGHGQGNISPQVDFWFWAVWVGILFLTVLRAGFVSTTAPVQAYLNDEMTRAHVRGAFTVGFTVSSIASVIGYGLVTSHLINVDGLMIGRSATDMGVVATVLAFVLFEWRAQHA
ncbi:hypothetical protein KPL74_18505 [Bacillus sp. NP157]|nr:hypothetical protein KPL74_18505 [Bacillus sp. NP157]